MKSAPENFLLEVRTGRVADLGGVRTAYAKHRRDGGVRAHATNLEGDDQADRKHHGGPDKAVYAYASEDYDWWSGEVGPVERGTFGENLTTAGIDLRRARVGDRWRVGTVELEVAQPRTPCFKLGIRMGDDDFPVPGEVHVQLQHLRAVALHGHAEGVQGVLGRQQGATAVRDVERGLEALEEGEERGRHERSSLSRGRGRGCPTVPGHRLDAHQHMTRTDSRLWELREKKTRTLPCPPM